MHRPQTAVPVSDQRGVSFSLRQEAPPDLAGAADAAPGGAGEVGLGGAASPLPSPLPGGSSTWSFEPAELKCVNTLSGHHSGIRAITVHGGRVFTGSYDHTIKAWNLDSGLCEATLEGHVAWVRCLLAHAREPLLFSGSDDGLIKVWRIGPSEHGCKLLTSLLGHCIQPAQQPPPAAPSAFYCPGSGGTDAEESEFPSRPGSAAPSRPQSASCGQRGGGGGGFGAGGAGAGGSEGGGGGGILSLALDYTRGWLLAGSHGATIYVWALPSYTLLLKLQGHRSAVKQLVLSGDCLLSGSYDRTIKLWAMQHRVKRHTPRGECTPDSRPAGLPPHPSHAPTFLG
jgi:WD40 repeat protein